MFSHNFSVTTYPKHNFSSCKVAARKVMFRVCRHGKVMLGQNKSYVSGVSTRKSYVGAKKKLCFGCVDTKKLCWGKKKVMFRVCRLTKSYVSFTTLCEKLCFGCVGPPKVIFRVQHGVESYVSNVSTPKKLSLTKSYVSGVSTRKSYGRAKKKLSPKTIHITKLCLQHNYTYLYNNRDTISASTATVRRRTG